MPEIPDPGYRPALMFLHEDMTANVDRVDFRLLPSRDRAILRALLTYTLSVLDDFEAVERSDA